MNLPPESPSQQRRPLTARKYVITFVAVAISLICGIGVILKGQSPTQEIDGATENRGAARQADTSGAAGAQTSPQQKPAGATAGMPGPEDFARGAGRTASSPARQQPAGANPPPAMRVPLNFLDTIVDASGKNARFQLPDGRPAAGAVDLIRHDDKGVLLVQGKLTQPQAGFYFFQRQTVPGKAGAIVGVVHFEKGNIAFRVDPSGPNGAPMLVQHPVNEVICRGMEKLPPDAAAAAETANAPQTHPTNIPIPADQNGVIPLQSLPGATAVVYLDFDGEPGPFAGWSSPTTAAPSGASNAQIKEVWQRVAEDFQPFNINVTTDRKVFDNAPQGRRQHVVITPSFNGGGVAFIGSFNWNGDTVCWSGYTTGKSAAEVISHEVGHTLHLGHDGRQPPGGDREDYYGGGGSPYEVSWAPIMGVGYYSNLSQWSKGEYTNPTNTEDDLVKITSNNNDVDYRQDDYGATLASAGYLEILSNNSVSNEGIIETRADVDAFRFATAGGAVTLNVSPVDQGPNLDILAELYDASNNLVTSSNPDTQISATINATLVAGEYTLRVSGVGRGNPLTDGNYSDYASLGAYLISGSVTGGVKPDRFTIQENRASGTFVGTVTPRKNHGGAALTYSIISGNTNNAFGINLTTGAITVSNASQLNFEALSSRWDDPARFVLFVSITNPSNPTLNETVRVVVSVEDVNEAPSISGDGSITILERTRVGTPVRKLSATDPDRFDFATFSITSGNTVGAFAINSATGEITVAQEIEISSQTVYTLTVQARDQRSPALTDSATVTITVLPIPAGYSPGEIMRTYFEGISGETVGNLTGNAKFPNNPDSEELLNAFDGGGHGDNYGSTVRGYLIPPVSGSYRFWIASDDSSELRLSSSANSAGATVIASVSGWTDQYQWTKFSSQQSTIINLQGGQPYYIEARHKEGGGGDHVAVAWQGPGISQQVVPGIYLAPFNQNYPPKVISNTYKVRENAFKGSTVGFVQVTDINAQDTHSGFTITGGTGAGIFGVDSGTGRIFVANNATLNANATSSYTLIVRANDSGTPSFAASATMTINVVAAGAVEVNGIVQQVWNNINGGNISALTGNSRYPNSPDSARTLSSFDSGEDIGENYGSRIRAYLVPPTSGTYTLYMASDDEGQLRLSSSTNPATATQVAAVPGHCGRDEWTKYPAQKSSSITLAAGQRYYIETLHKEGAVTDFVRVAWTGPGISSITTIPGSALQPFDINVAPVWNGAPYTFSTVDRAINGIRVGTVSATDGAGETLTYAILNGNSSGAFAIDPQTGDITVANASALVRGQTVSLQIGVQDDGGGVYPLKSSTTTAAITVRALSSGAYEHAVVTKSPVAYWRLNETSGTTALDYYSRYNGTHTGGVTLGYPGPRPSAFPRFETGNFAAKYNGSGSHTALPALNLHSNTVTITAWVRRNGNAAVFSGLVFSRAGNSIAGLHFGNANELRYTWNNANATYEWNSGLVPPDNQWTFVALVVEPSRATLYMNGGSGLVSAVNNVAHAIEEFDGAMWIAQDTHNGNRFFNGTVDEVAIFNRALTPEEIGHLDFLPTVTLTATDNAASEGVGNPGVYQLTRTGPTTSNLVVAVSSSGTAILGTDYTLSPSGTTVTIPAGQASASITLQPIDDSGIEGTETAVLSFGAGDYVVASPGLASIGIADNDVQPIEQWRQDKFGANASNPTISGDTEDPDQDGLSNLLEYALNLDPQAPGGSSVTTEVATVGNERYLRLTVAKNPNASDVVVSAEVSGSLNPPSWTTNGVTVEVNNGTTLQVRDTVPVGTGGQRYLRLKVTRP